MTGAPAEQHPQQPSSLTDFLSTTDSHDHAGQYTPQAYPPAVSGVNQPASGATSGATERQAGGVGDYHHDGHGAGANSNDAVAGNNGRLSLSPGAVQQGTPCVDVPDSDPHHEHLLSWPSPLLDAATMDSELLLLLMMTQSARPIAASRPSAGRCDAQLQGGTAPGSVDWQGTREGGRAWVPQGQGRLGDDGPPGATGARPHQASSHSAAKASDAGQGNIAAAAAAAEMVGALVAVRSSHAPSSFMPHARPPPPGRHLQFGGRGSGDGHHSTPSSHGAAVAHAPAPAAVVDAATLTGAPPATPGGTDGEMNPWQEQQQQQQPEIGWTGTERSTSQV